MTPIEKIRQSISPEIERLNKQINDALSSSNGLMTRVVDGYLTTKGKQLRPCLVILTAKLFGEVNEKVIAAAASVEMLHNATLIHDDVVDESKMRRSQPTVNSLWDNQIAVLVGDFFVSSALQQSISTGDLRIVEALAHLGKVLSLGEVDQIYNARYHCLDEQAYYKIISHKTASLFVSCIKMGAYSVGADGEQLKQMERYAELLGLCFQIRDDIFDYFGSKEVGKPTGNDLREGKITLPLLYALNRSELPEHDAMLELSKKEVLDEDEIAILIDFAKRAGGIEYAYESMERLKDEAFDMLKSFPESDTLSAFRDIFNYVISRDY
ncbi:MAG: polyprenyl synthetase family protein [Firmicutes bacterium]|nr:polyprenyl synthetase family protein [Bacillota bacterium]MCM1401954.1 polyprenyl synthetase family protein [Bacteroides sp.]MCM1477973.1 polyprenyl synthetase family protein [Bacteroides sp.]